MSTNETAQDADPEENKSTHFRKLLLLFGVVPGALDGCSALVTSLDESLQDCPHVFLNQIVVGPGGAAPTGTVASNLAFDGGLFMLLLLTVPVVVICSFVVCAILEGIHKLVRPDRATLALHEVLVFFLWAALSWFASAGVDSVVASHQRNSNICASADEPVGTSVGDNVVGPTLSDRPLDAHEGVNQIAEMAEKSANDLEADAEALRDAINGL